MHSSYILPFEQCNAANRNVVGGKCANLGTMCNAKLPVPPGFAITTLAYQAMLDSNNLRQKIHSLLKQFSVNDIDSNEIISKTIRSLIENTPLPIDVERSVRTAYTSMCEKLEINNVPVAVRSSAITEDSSSFAFAGQQDTFLWIVGTDSLVEHIKKCWSSLYSLRAIAYRTDNGFSQEETICVGIQKMVNAKAAGVAFTLNPINGDRSKIVIDANWGLGHTVVSGQVTPDNFVVDKVIFAVISEKISSKHMELIVDRSRQRIIESPIEIERQAQSCLTYDEVITIAKIVKIVEQLYCEPQDVEWAIDAELLAPNNILVLQSRQETVWGQKKSNSSNSNRIYKTGIDGVLETLLMKIK